MIVCHRGDFCGSLDEHFDAIPLWFLACKKDKKPPDLISKRIKESLAAKKLSGIKLGRPTGPGKIKLNQFRSEIEALLLSGSSQKYIADHYRIIEATLSNWIKKNSVKTYRKLA